MRLISCRWVTYEYIEFVERVTIDIDGRVRGKSTNATIASGSILFVGILPGQHVASGMPQWRMFVTSCYI